MAILSDLKHDISAIYAGVFGRLPDGEGLSYWEFQASDNNWDTSALAENMLAAAIQYSGYESLSDPFTLVTTVYENMLGKSYSDDPDGIKYWVDQIKSGATTMGKVIADILYAAVTQYPNETATLTLEKRAEAGIKFADLYKDADVDHNGKVESSDINVFKSALESVSSTTDVDTWIQGYQAPHTGQTFTLTDKIDTIQGTGYDDLIIGDNSGTVATAQIGDVINGGEGTDTLKLYAYANGLLPQIKSVENVELYNFGTAFSPTINTTPNSDVEKITFSLLTGARTINYLSTQEIDLVNDNAGTLTLNPNTGDTVSVKLQSVSGTTVKVSNAAADGTKIANIQIDSTGSNKINVNGPAAGFDHNVTVKITGTGSLDITDKINTTAATKTVSIDASGNSAGVNITVTAAARLPKSVIGTSAEDTLTVNANYTPAKDSDLQSIETVKAGTSGITIDLSSQKEAFNITGYTGNETLKGGSGADTIDGGKGNDTIYGNGGADKLTGGDGADKFVFNDFTAVDTITDFKSGTDGLYVDIGLKGAINANNKLATGVYNAAGTKVIVAKANAAGNPAGTANIAVNASLGAAVALTANELFVQKSITALKSHISGAQAALDNKKVAIFAETTANHNLYVLLASDVNAAAGAANVKVQSIKTIAHVDANFVATDVHVF